MFYCFLSLGIRMKRILFVCVENAGRSQMAEAFANHYGKGKLIVRVQATSQPTRLTPCG